MDNALVPCTLDVINMTAAQEQYKDFVDVSNAELTISQFKTKRGLPLNEQYFSVLYAKTAHLKDIDFIEVERPILEMVGFKNTVYEQKGKNGLAKRDRHGNIKYKDTQCDFYSAVRCPRNTAEFKEGSSFEDVDAHFIVMKTKPMELQYGRTKKTVSMGSKRCF